MDTVASLNWLKKSNLYEISEKLSLQIKKLFAPCLNAKDEKVLVIGDTGFQNKGIAAVLSGAYYLAAQQLSLDAKLVFQSVKSRGDNADEDIANSLSITTALTPSSIRSKVVSRNNRSGGSNRV